MNIISTYIFIEHKHTKKHTASSKLTWKMSDVACVIIHPHLYKQ